MRYLTLKQTSDRTGLSPQTIRKCFPVTKFGHSVRIWEGELSKVANQRAIAAIQGDPGLRAIMDHYRNAEMVIEHLDPNPDAIADAEMVALLVSSIAACRAEHPDWPMIGVDEVYPPTLAFLKANLPRGGGFKGAELQALILAA